jgi:hypothetical protein
MAEFDALDELLSGSLKRAAQPGDSTGVADTIRARVAAGDVGTPAPSGGSAPGFGGGLASWIPWVGLLVVGALVGGVLGVTGVFGHPIDIVTVGTSSILMPPTVQASSCPDGPVVASVERGSRVVALARSADGALVQVRNPSDVSQLVWIPVGELVSDSGQTPVAGLPIGPSCPTVTVAQAPVVTPVTPVTPGKKPKPPTPDTTPPVIGAITVDTSNACKPIVTAQITDNVGVSSATLKGTSGSPYNVNQTVAMTHPGGSNWKGTLTMPSNFSGIVNLTITARDAAGNTTVTSSKFTDPSCPIG